VEKKRITLFVDSKVYDEYKSYCKSNGLIISKKVELFMRKELKKNRDFNENK